MAVLLVTYDLKKPGQDYSDLLKAIKSFSWARLSESSYAIQTDASAVNVYNVLRPFMDGNDTLYIINMTKPWMGFGPKEVNEWLEECLPQPR